MLLPAQVPFAELVWLARLSVPNSQGSALNICLTPYPPHQSDYYQIAVWQIMIDGNSSFSRITALGFVVGKMW
jgi:hypothetical protein